MHGIVRFCKHLASLTQYHCVNVFRMHGRRTRRAGTMGEHDCSACGLHHAHSHQHHPFSKFLHACVHPTNCRFKEQSLSKVLVQACNLDVNANANANKAVNWRRGSGKSAGNFPAAMEEVNIDNSTCCSACMQFSMLFECPRIRMVSPAVGLVLA